MSHAPCDVDTVSNLLANVDVQHEIAFPGTAQKLSTRDSVKDFCEEIEKCIHMTALRLEGNSFGVDAASAIGDVIKKHPEFEKAFWSDMFTGRLKHEIPHALEHLGDGIIAAGAGLVELDLSDNAFGPNGLEGLTRFLKSSSCYTLKYLKLNNCGLGPFGGKMLADCLIDCHKNSLKDNKPLALKVFISGRNRLENQGAQALAEAFKTIGTLEEITMLQNFIQHKGVSALSDAILYNKKLRLINLNDNTFTEKGADSIAKVIPLLPHLEVINFGDCLIRTEGAKLIAKALTPNHTKLKEIILCGNEIGPEAIDDLCKLTENKTELSSFDLNANEFGADGVAELKSQMQKYQQTTALMTLSDDEGDDDEEEEGDSGSSTEQSDTEELADQLQATSVKDKPIPKPAIQVGTLSLEDFLREPTPIQYRQLGPQENKELINYISNMPYDVDEMIKLFIIIAQATPIGIDNTEDIITTIQECTDEIMRRLFEANDSNTAVILNTLLSCLGLIKNEDKKYKAPANITSTISTLQHTVQQSFFSATARSILLTFIDKPNSMFDKCTKERHNLLQILYKL